MFGFPIGNGNSGFNDFVEKFTNDADSGFPKIQQREVFYSVKDGNWNDTTMWQTASGRVGLLPTANDDVYIRHIMTMNLTSQQCYNLFISSTGRYTTDAPARVFTVNGNIQSKGVIDLSIGNTSQTLVLLGNNNSIDTLINSTSSGIQYNGVLDQLILPNINYVDLVISNGIKFITSDLNVGRNFTLSNSTGDSTRAFLDLGYYNLSVTGNLLIGFFSRLDKSNSGSIYIGGNFACNNSGWLQLTGNPSVEIRGGITNAITSTQGRWYTGTGTWSFTTNNQSITGAGSDLPFDCPIIISGAITLTNTSRIVLNNTINGDNALSKLTNGLNGIIYFATQLSAENSMTTGLFDFTTSANTIQYRGDYSATIPSYFTTFHNLTISGTGTKTLSVNTTLNGNLNVATSTFEMSTYNLNVNGTTFCQTGILKKSGAGNVLFVGLISITGQFAANVLDFTGGNPNVEVRNGIANPFGNIGSFKSGTGTWSFTTNSQALGSGAYSSTMYFDGPVIIGSGVTLTVNTPLVVILNNSITGATGILINKSTIYLNNSSHPTFSVGTVDFTTNANTIGYTFNGDYTIPYTSLYSLYIEGTGTKYTSANTTLLGGLTFAGTGKLDLTTYNLTVTGTTFFNGNGGGLFKTGAGSVLFIGLITTAYQAYTFDFTGGNPNVEVRGGMSMNSQGGTTFKSGTGTWSFTTNNQSFGQTVYGGTYIFNGNVFIGNGITLTYSGNSYNIYIYGTLNGGDASSKFLLGTGSNLVTYYYNATQPMVTGILDTSTNLNTWIYGNGNQDIKGNTTAGQFQQYRNLTLNGGGTKTLQGNINVQNTYTLTAPAILDLNGYTKTP